MKLPKVEVDVGAKVSFAPKDLKSIIAPTLGAPLDKKAAFLISHKYKMFLDSCAIKNERKPMITYLSDDVSTNVSLQRSTLTTFQTESSADFTSAYDNEDTVSFSAGNQPTNYIYLSTNYTGTTSSAAEITFPWLAWPTVGDSGVTFSPPIFVSKEEKLRQKIQQNLSYRGSPWESIPRSAGFALDQIVTPSEMRALKLLRQVIPPKDFRKYLKCGGITIRGRSGLQYFVERKKSIKVYDKGTKVASLCIHLSQNLATPPTDEVVAKILMIQFDEESLWKKAAVTSYGTVYGNCFLLGRGECQAVAV